jgi:hypothetical protein
MNHDQPSRSAEDLYLRYLERHPGHISDLLFVMEIKRERSDHAGQ